MRVWIVMEDDQPYAVLSTKSKAEALCRRQNRAYKAAAEAKGGYMVMCPYGVGPEEGLVIDWSPVSTEWSGGRGTPEENA